MGSIQNPRRCAGTTTRGWLLLRDAKGKPHPECCLVMHHKLWVCVFLVLTVLMCLGWGRRHVSSCRHSLQRLHLDHSENFLDDKAHMTL